MCKVIKPFEAIPSTETQDLPLGPSQVAPKPQEVDLLQLHPQVSAFPALKSVSNPSLPPRDQATLNN